LLVNPPRGEALSLSTLDQANGALVIRDLAGVVAERKLGHVAVKVRFLNRVERAGNAALQDRKEILIRVRAPLTMQVSRTAAKHGKFLAQHKPADTADEAAHKADKGANTTTEITVGRVFG
jgi:hypothetical protein